MVIELGALGKGILLGLGAAVPIGPVNVEIARRTLHGGFRNGFALGCGASTVDAVYAVLVSLGVGAALGRNEAVQMALAIAGALVLGYLAWGCLRGAWGAWRGRATGRLGDEAAAAGGEGNDVAKLGRAYGAGFLMTLANPMTLVFWFVGVTGSAQTLLGGEPGALPWLSAGVGLGAVAWVVFFAGTLSVAGRWKRGMWVVATDLFGGLILLAFALAAAWRVVVGKG